ncbi:hypothetical protein H2199_003203 [Coniosporium tulheliwenetii]|uniref:Uncharacterized protein n=1 Tax=Coniosporium tulheliwenetii TaxID=3383036 RepID=A0ACC2ZD06_9PEZI|nr:hypothetical protein H2199_003203 [Cladosporium sp. JES 115]
MQFKQIVQYIFRERDDRWRGVTRYGPLLLIPISISVILLWIFSTASLVYSATIGMEESCYNCTYGACAGRMSCYPVAITPIGWHSAEEGASEVFARISILTVETVHLPLHLWAYFRSRLHPVWALCLSIALIGGWLCQAIFAWAMDHIGGAYYTAVWNGLATFRAVLGFGVAIAYFVYMGFAAHAVKLWRKANKRRANEREEEWRTTMGTGRGGSEEARVDSMELQKL